MHDLIDRYMESHLSLDPKEVAILHKTYSKDYGLAIKGLVHHHKIDALDFNREVDDALPLDEIILPSPTLRQFLLDIDKQKVKLWLFTNAHVTHGQRVVRLLGIDDLFEGITYCDYSAKELLPKPETPAYEKAEKEAGATPGRDIYFVGEFAPRYLKTPQLIVLQMTPTSIAITGRPVAGQLSIYWNQARKNQMFQPQSTGLIDLRGFESSSHSSSGHKRRQYVNKLTTNTGVAVETLLSLKLNPRPRIYPANMGGCNQWI
jgi:pyrimidine 5'-nucleotidase